MRWRKRQNDKSNDVDLEVEVSSPVCSMHEADDAYMGYASKNELIAFLNELLEVERAGARATLESAPIAGSYRIAEVLRTIQRDETRWCAMLSGHIKALGEVPSRRVGAFYGKATAMGGLGDRITFLSRGQRLVVRKLREMLPRVHNDQLHAAMLHSHEGNITLVNDLVASLSEG